MTEQDFLGGQQAVVIAVPGLEFLKFLAPLAPFVEGDLAVLVGVEVGEPLGQLLGKLAGAEDDGPLVQRILIDNDGDGVGGLVQVAAAACLETGDEIGLEFVEAEEVVAIGVPLAQLGFEGLGHLVHVEEAIAILVAALELGLGPLEKGLVLIGGHRHGIRIVSSLGW